MLTWQNKLLPWRPHWGFQTITPLIYVNHEGRDDEDERDRTGEKIRKVADRDVGR